MNIKHITSLSDPQLNIFCRLTEAQLRNRLEPELGVFIAESPKVIAIALKRGYEPTAVLTEEKFIETQVNAFADQLGDISVYVGSSQLLAQLTGYELSRGMICAMKRPKLPTVGEVCSQKRRIVIVDGVVNATNTGAIFRAAAALGMDGLIFSHTCCDPLNRRSVRVSMGTVFQLPWTQLDKQTRLPQLFDQMRTDGFKIISMALSNNALPIDDQQIAKHNKLAIVLGNEGEGLDNETIKASDYEAMIPMQNGVDSLNVAAAAAVAFWQLKSK
ncbi:MAG: RNA methyltransferase [Bacteroidales bacterium]|nr:RNA methyltransferase [Bacteroidales bacterium]